MGCVSTLKALFTSKKGQKNINKHTRVAEQMVRDYQSDFNPTNFPPVSHAHPYYYSKVQVGQPVSELPPVHDALNDHGSTSSRPEATVAHSICSIEYMDDWYNFDGAHCSTDEDSGHSADCTSDYDSTDSSTLPARLVFLSYRKGESCPGRIEELETAQLKRSNAPVKEKYTEKVRLKYESCPDVGSTLRPLSCNLSTDEPMSSFENVMAYAKDGLLSCASDGEMEVLRSESALCPHRRDTMRKVTLARLEGRR
jgi:hypothetical protein